jgi:predicted O-methyltransferase YrrM
MSNELWAQVDRYLTETLATEDAALQAAAAASEAAGLPEIAVPAPQGKLLHLLALIRGAKRILEIGTLGGYSTIWLARALPADGKLVTLEINPAYAAVARRNLERAGLAQLVELRLGPALETLAQLAAEQAGPFDMVFIDADKRSNAAYFTWALRLTRPGSLIIVDNIVRRGAIVDTASDDEDVNGARRAIELIAAEPRVTATAIQTVCGKGHDGFILAVVK